MTRRSTLVAVLAIALPAIAGAQATRELTSPSGRRAAYSRDRGTVVLSLLEEPGELRASDPGPSVQIFGDGRARVHYPSYMIQSGDYDVQLTAAELDDLVTRTVEGRLPEFDADQVKRRKTAVLASRNREGATVFETSDASVSTIQIELENYQPANAAGGAQPKALAGKTKRSLRWSAVQFDAEHLPEIEELQGLQEVRSRLLAVMERNDKQRVK